MSEQRPDRVQRAGTRRLFLWAALVAIVLGLGVTFWPMLMDHELGQPLQRRAGDQRTPNETTGTKSNQTEGRSTAGEVKSASSAADATADDQGERG